MPVKELPKATPLRELVGQTIEIVSMGEPVRQTGSSVATLANGGHVWIPKHVEFDGDVAGRYVVVSFETGRSDNPTGYSLRNATD